MLIAFELLVGELDGLSPSVNLFKPAQFLFILLLDFWLESLMDSLHHLKEEVAGAGLALLQHTNSFKYTWQIIIHEI